MISYTFRASYQHDAIGLISMLNPERIKLIAIYNILIGGGLAPPDVEVVIETNYKVEEILEITRHIHRGKRIFETFSITSEYTGKRKRVGFREALNNRYYLSNNRRENQ